MGENKTSKKGGCLKKLLLGLFGFVFVIGIIGVVNLPDSAKMPKELSVIAEQTKTNQEQTAEIKKILDSVGVDEISEIKYDSMYDYEGEKGYRMVSHGQKNVILILNNNIVKEVRFANSILYGDGAVKGNLKDHYFSQAEIDKYGMIAQKAVTACLKSPKSADFPNWFDWDWAYDEDKTILTSSYVDAQNSFGANIRSEFVVRLSQSGETVLQIVIDGREVYNIYK